MNLEYKTERLNLRILTGGCEQHVLHFLLENRTLFEKYEPPREQHFYTLEYQRALLNSEFVDIMHFQRLRLWVSLRERPDRIIGTVSFQNVKPQYFQSCQIGYKFAPDFWHQGYARESLFFAIPLFAEAASIHRFEAYTLPENMASKRLLNSLGFQKEGLLREYAFVNHQWQDHELYALIYT